jgi:hypothetical protein
LELNKNIKFTLKYVFGPLVFCILAFSIYKQVLNQPGWQQSSGSIREVLQGKGLFELGLVFLLMFVNWGIEARKWQLALRHLETITFWRSLKAVFTGTTMAFFTPNRIGEYLGRILYIREGKRLQAITLTIVCSMAQLLVTIVTGIVGLIFIRSYVAQNTTDAYSVIFWFQLVLYVAIVAGVFMIFFYFRLSWLVKALGRVTIMGKYLRYVKVLDEFNATILLRILSLSLFRYLVFLLQYYLLFDVFDVVIDWWQSACVISVMFLVLAMAPTIAFLTDLGIRAKASIELVQFFSGNVVGILATSLSIWFINLVIPALIGSLLILGIKLGGYQSKQKKSLTDKSMDSVL